MEEKLREYAKLLIELGVNVQPGQTLVIASPVDCAHFARLCVAEAYAAGCREVVMSWKDDFLTRERYLHADDAVFDEVADWQRHFFNDYAREGAAYLSISATDPENLKGVDPARLVRAQRAGYFSAHGADGTMTVVSGSGWTFSAPLNEKAPAATIDYNTSPPFSQGKRRFSPRFPLFFPKIRFVFLSISAAVWFRKHERPDHFLHKTII